MTTIFSARKSAASTRLTGDRALSKRDEGELSDFDANIERQERKRNVALRQAEGGQAAGEAEAVQETEREGDDPRAPDGKARLAAPGADDLRAEEQDRERDRRVERRGGNARIAKRRGGESDAVGDREGADGLEKLHDMLPADEPGTSEGRTPATNQTVRTVFVVGPDKEWFSRCVAPASGPRQQTFHNPIASSAAAVMKVTAPADP